MKAPGEKLVTRESAFESDTDALKEGFEAGVLSARLRSQTGWMKDVLEAAFGVVTLYQAGPPKLEELAAAIGKLDKALSNVKTKVKTTRRKKA